MDIVLQQSLSFSLSMLTLPLIMHNDLTACISQQLEAPWIKNRNPEFLQKFQKLTKKYNSFHKISSAVIK